MSDLEKLIEDVAIEQAFCNCKELGYTEGGSTVMCEHVAIASMLKRRLLPLLEAGQAMRDWEPNVYENWARMQKAWDAAREKAKASK